MEEREIVILGGGLAGLTAAYELQKRGVSCLILEARSRIGGRIKTTKTDSGAMIEMGATWFADKHVHLMELVRELSVTFQDQYVGTKVLYDYENQGRQIQLFETPLQTESQYLFSNGTYSLISVLYQQLNPNDVYLGQNVRVLEIDEQGIIVHSNELQIRAKKVISTLPLNLFINQVEVTHELPVKLKDLASKTHTWMGESIKVGLEFSNDFWREKGIGLLLSQFGPASELHDHQHSEGNGHVLKGFFDPKYHLHSRNDREAKVMEQLRVYFGPSLPTVTYYEKDWQRDSHTFQPYISEVLPHQNNGHPVFRESFFEGRLHFAGSETAEYFPGYLDGAVERGKAIAKKIRDLQLSQSL